MTIRYLDPKGSLQCPSSAGRRRRHRDPELLFHNTDLLWLLSGTVPFLPMLDVSYVDSTIPSIFRP